MAITELSSERKNTFQGLFGVDYLTADAEIVRKYNVALELELDNLQTIKKFPQFALPIWMELQLFEIKEQIWAEAIRRSEVGAYPLTDRLMTIRSKKYSQHGLKVNRTQTLNGHTVGTSYQFKPTNDYLLILNP